MAQIGSLDLQLPPRLFAESQIPKRRTVHFYSKIEYLSTIKECLSGTTQWETLLNSPFGSLFKLPLANCLNSGVLLHSLLCRQLVTKKKNELWFVFGGHPFKFSLREFGMVTGLACSPFPPESTIKEVEQAIGSTSIWSHLFGEETNLTVPQLKEKLEKGKEDMDPAKKLMIALIIIVDGIIVCNIQLATVTTKYVE